MPNEIVQLDNMLIRRQLHKQHFPVYNCVCQVERGRITVSFDEETGAGDDLDGSSESGVRCMGRKADCRWTDIAYNTSQGKQKTNNGDRKSCKDGDTYTSSHSQ
jgi:hypothetical protein